MNKKRRERLKLLKRMKALRNDILTTDNAGRKKYLLSHLIQYTNYVSRESSDETSLKITLIGGWEYYYVADSLGEVFDVVAKDYVDMVFKGRYIMGLKGEEGC